MKKYYTRVCNFYYGNISKNLVKKKKTIPLNGDLNISFDHIEIISRESTKKIHIKNIKKLPKNLINKVNYDIKKIKKKHKNFSNFNFKDNPNIMGVLNLTPDSFSDGGKFNSKDQGYNHAKYLFKLGAKIIDIGGESTRPKSKEVKASNEWNRIKKTIIKLKKKIPISLDTTKSEIMKKGIKYGVKLINDISGLRNDRETISLLSNKKIPFVIHHTQGTPEDMQNNPKYKNVLLDIYDFFEERISYIRQNKIKHNNIILDPGIGFGKNLKHNMKLITGISIFYSLGFPVMLGMSRKSFINKISGKNGSKKKLGGTVGSCLFAMMQGVQILRIHDVNEVLQGIKVFKKLNKE